MPKSADALKISPEERRTLEAWVRAQNTPQSVALLAAEGPNSRIAREVDVSRTTVILWRRRFGTSWRAALEPSPRSHQAGVGGSPTEPSV